MRANPRRFDPRCSTRVLHGPASVSTVSRDTLNPVGRKVLTAAEFEKLSPGEQDAIFEAGIVTNLDDAPADFLERVRARLREHITSAEATDVGQ